MTLALAVILDLHQDGLRVHINVDRGGEELRLTGPDGEQMSVPFRQLALFREMLSVASAAITLRSSHAPSRS